MKLLFLTLMLLVLAGCGAEPSRVPGPQRPLSEADCQAADRHLAPDGQTCMPHFTGEPARTNTSQKGSGD